MSTTFRIKHLSGSLAGREQRIALSEGQAIRLGRGPENDVKFNAAVDDTVSGVHAELSWRDGRLTIEDQKSSNGTFVNGAPCPPFEKLAVPDGSRIRLGREGPEMQVTFEAAASGRPAAGAAARPTQAESAAEPKQAVGRETLLREIDRAKQEERDHVVDEIDRSRKKTGLWLAAASVVLVALVAGGMWLATRSSAARVEDSRRDLEERIDRAGENVWGEVETMGRPAVGHVRVRYHLTQPQLVNGETALPVELLTREVAGSAVLIESGLAITAKHVAEPWKYLLEWAETEYRDWEHFAKDKNLKPVYERLEIQFPGLQPISVSLRASSETSDLALLSVPDVAIQPVSVEFSNEAISVTDEVAILGYPYSLGTLKLAARDVSQGQSFFTQIRDMEPTFIKGTVSRPVHEVGETSRYFFLDASIEPGNSGGPVLDREGRVIGIISMRLEIGDTIEFEGQAFPKLREVESAARAVSPADIADFLERAGVR